MRVYLGSDHAGFELKAKLVAHLGEQGHEAVDCGAHTYDPQDDYPPPCIPPPRARWPTRASLGIVIGGSGNGEQIAANKVRGVRAALIWNDETARLAREHNDANIMSLGRSRPPRRGRDPLRRHLRLDTRSRKAERHARRIAMLAEYEATGAIAGHETS